ncbi:hypothetical protein ACVWYN_003683 [Pedobacter sp. UYP24]
MIEIYLLKAYISVSTSYSIIMSNLMKYYIRTLTAAIEGYMNLIRQTSKLD